MDSELVVDHHHQMDFVQHLLYHLHQMDFIQRY